jgi:hypothetical protein
MVELTTEQFEAAKARGEARMRGPRAASVHYDAGRNRVLGTAAGRTRSPAKATASREYCRRGGRPAKLRPPVGSSHRQSRRTGPDAPVARDQALVVARRCDVS